MSFMPPRTKVVIPAILAEHARAHGDRTCVVFADEASWTYRRADAVATTAAAQLADRGVRRGDHVLLFLPNGADWLRAWWGVACAGAVVVPVNTAQRGATLRHQCANSGAKVIVTSNELGSRLDDMGIDLQRIDPSELAAEHPSPLRVEGIEPWDVHSINYTSGTTGPAKGVIVSWLQLYHGGNGVFGAGAGLVEDDRFLVDLPLFHAATERIVASSLSVGASIAVLPGFDGRNYWVSVARLGATRALLASSMASFLLDQPRRVSDRGHGLRVLVSAPLPADPKGFTDRFGIEGIIASFGSTETGAPIVSRRGEDCPQGSCGRARPGIELRIVDEFDQPLDDGIVGELTMRTDAPWELSVGYFGDAAASAASWRNGWFHTGDAFRSDSDGFYYFIDRMRDTLRRRGENISSFEVEGAVRQHPLVADVACIGVPSDYGADEDVKVIVVRNDDTLRPQDLIEFLVPRLPHYMVPRYVQFVNDLPRTETQRVQKNRLRDVDLGTAVWDIAEQGWRVTSDGLVAIRVDEPIELAKES